MSQLKLKVSLFSAYDDNVGFAISITSDGKNLDRENVVAYIGRKLSTYGLVGTLYLSGDIITGEYSWENPDYIIQEGNQTVVLIFTNYYGREWKSNVSFMG